MGGKRKLKDCEEEEDTENKDDNIMEAVMVADDVYDSTDTESIVSSIDMSDDTWRSIALIQ
jgi:hypothetical protein